MEDFIDLFQCHGTEGAGLCPSIVVWLIDIDGWKRLGAPLRDGAQRTQGHSIDNALLLVSWEGAELVAPRCAARIRANDKRRMCRRRSRSLTTAVLGSPAPPNFALSLASRNLGLPTVKWST